MIFLVNRYYFNFLPLFRETFILKTIPKENCLWFEIGETRFFSTNRHIIMPMSLIKNQGPYKLYNIILTNFKVRQSFLGFKSHVRWDSTVVVFCHEVLTKVTIEQIWFYQKICYKLITY